MVHCKGERNSVMWTWRAGWQSGVARRLSSGSCRAWSARPAIAHSAYPSTTPPSRLNTLKYKISIFYQVSSSSVIIKQLRNYPYVQSAMEMGIRPPN